MGIFSVFFVEIPGRAISGLCSRSGCSQLFLSSAPFDLIPEDVFSTNSLQEVPIFAGFPLKNPTSKANAQSSSKRILFVRVQFGGVPSTVKVEEVTLLKDQQGKHMPKKQYSDTVI